MSDLCAPLYVVMGPEEEELVFWCFVEVMNRMVVCIHRRVNDLVLMSCRNKTSSATKAA